MRQKGKWTIGKASMLIVLALIITIGCFLGIRYLKNVSLSEEVDEVYVTSVAYLTKGNIGGTINRFSGVVESPETWSCNANPEYKVASVLVAVGQTVNEGQALFTYDVNAFQDSLAKAEIELARLNADLNTLDDTIKELVREQKKAEKNQKANFTIQIKQQELERKQREFDITAKKEEIQKIQDNINNATVYSAISGVVQSINESSTSQGQDSGNSGFIKIMKTGDLRVKGTVNEQNIGEIYEGLPMLIHSRVDESLVWSGTVTKIDRENARGNPYASMFGNDGGSSSNYPFYVELSGSDGLMMGQHVYLEPDVGQNDAEAHQGIWLDAYYIDETGDPFVWADDGGKLVKKPVTLGERDEELGKVQILEGLTESDRIAFPEDTLHEGMNAIDSASMTGEEAAEDVENPEKLT